jgi:UDP-glucose 4-epimerase
MATVLVTGGAGFIGSHVVDRLLARGDSVVVLDDFSTGRRENLPIGNPKLKVLEGSVHDVLRWQAELQHVTCVFHLAALISGFESQQTPDPYLHTNVTGLLRLFDLLRRLEKPRLVFASTSNVYGNSPERIRREGQLPSPATVYGLTKLIAEHLFDIYRQSVGFDDVSFRLFNVYGPRQNRDHPYANVACKFSWAAATGNSVVLYGDGEQTRDFVYVDDVVRALVGAMDRRTPRRIYNVGTGQDCSINQLLELAQSIAGTRLNVERRGEWPNDLRAIAADVSRFKEDFGFVPETPVREGLARTIEFFRRNDG